LNRCPISFQPLEDDADYSAAGLRMLDRNLRALDRLELTATQQRLEAIQRVGKMSVQGLQPKLSAVLRVRKGRFEIVDCGGRFILKPPSLDFAQLPENEDVTMRMARAVGIEVPTHGLLRAIDDSLTYFIRRFDRQGRGRLPVEDFAQLSGADRDTKYDSSMEKVAAVVDAFCTFPAIERVKLFERTLFSFLIGNEDMHLKNFSLITRDGKTEMSPAYDLLNTTIAIPKPREQMALPLNGKKTNFTRKDLMDYYGKQRLQINDRVLSGVLTRFQEGFAEWLKLLDQSFLSNDMRQRFYILLSERKQRLGL
jgi:serine/threonine-protein kinase HipA